MRPTPKFLFSVILFVPHSLLFVALAEGEEGGMGASLVSSLIRAVWDQQDMSGTSPPWKSSPLAQPLPQLPPSRCHSAWIVKMGWLKFATRKSSWLSLLSPSVVQPQRASSMAVDVS